MKIYGNVRRCSDVISYRCKDISTQAAFRFNSIWFNRSLVSVVYSSVVSDFHSAVHDGRSHHLMQSESLTDRIPIMERVWLLPVCCYCVYHHICHVWAITNWICVLSHEQNSRPDCFKMFWQWFWPLSDILVATCAISVSTLVNTWPRQLRRCIHVLDDLTSIKRSVRNAVERDRRYLEALRRHTAKNTLVCSCLTLVITNICLWKRCVLC